MITITGKNIVKTLDGKGSASSNYAGDGQIGKFELANAGIQNRLISAVLRNQGNGDGFLDAGEFQTLLDKKIIALNGDQLIVGGFLASAVSTPQKTSSLGFVGKDLHGKDFYPDLDADGDADLVIFVDNEVDLEVLKTAIGKIEEASGHRLDFQIVTGSNKKYANSVNGIWLEVVPGDDEFAGGGILGAEGGGNIEIREGYESELQIIMHELLHAIGLDHDDGDQVLLGWNNNIPINDFSQLEIANIIKTSDDYRPGRNNRPNEPIAIEHYLP